MSESAFYFEVDGAPVFAISHHPPAGTLRGGVVLCHALGEEKHWAHRTLVGLARALSQAGIAVLRFDYRGEGESALEFEQAGIATRVADSVRAAEVLLAQAPQLHAVTLLGHRLGAAIAAAAATFLGARVRGVILWDAISDGRAYLLELLRSTLASRLALVGSAPTRAALLAALEQGESVNVEGYGISPAFYRELIALRLPELLSRLPCPVLTVQSPPGVTPWRESRQYVQDAPDVARRAREWLENRA